MMEGPEWREASSLIIASSVRPLSENFDEHPKNSSSKSTESTNNCDYKLLMTKRSAKSSFLASAFVFPGGHLEPSDFSPKWWAVFENAGFTRSDVMSVVERIHGPRPPIVTDCQVRTVAKSAMVQESDQLLHADIGLRICAIRETFEEAGILLVERMNIGTCFVSRDPLVEPEKWRRLVQENSENFAELCLRMKCAPNIWELREWWNWLTPNALGHKRFDTMFYVYCTESSLDAISDGKEVSIIEWYSPKQLLDLHKDKKAFLAPPQVYELSRFSNFDHYQRLWDFVVTRESLGVQRWRPIMTGYQDGTALLLPGDDIYIKKTSEKEPEESNIRSMPTLEEARSKTVNLNRIEFRVPVFQAYCNMQLSCGHVSPSSPAPMVPVLRSAL